MENQDQMNPDFWKEAERRHKRGKIAGGILLVVIGALFLGRELGMYLPHWIFSWKMLLIAIGTLIIVKDDRKNLKGYLLILIGGMFLVADMLPEMGLRSLMWPILVIIIGLYIIFKPRNRHHFKHKMQRKYQRHQWHFGEGYEVSDDDKIESTTFMGGVKKNIISKNFKGGEITNVMGGVEIDLSQADFVGTATLEVTNVLGGAALVIPANWEIQSELVSVMGSIEDKRPVHANISQVSPKILILRGTVFMGGIDIKSY
ncbi:MAG: hypothetical protein JNL24_12520 [Bacteroidia bacterium]|nr:hypothetical protein [Bacteroidia bacterium]